MSPRHAPPDEAPSWFVVQLTATASLGGCLFGYDMGAISGALPQLQHSFDLSYSQLESLVSVLYLGGGFGASIGGSICDSMGRKWTIILTDIVFMLGACWLYFATSYGQVLVGRFVVGIGVAIAGVADVSYLHECAPVEWRGSIVSVNEACISLGFLLAYVAGFVFNNPDKEEWRIIFGLAGLLAFVQLVGMIKLPESPVWLAERGRVEDARKARQQFNSGRGSISDNEDGTNENINPVLGDERTEQTDSTRIPLPPAATSDENMETDNIVVPSKYVISNSPLEETYQHPKSELCDGDSIPSFHNSMSARIRTAFQVFGTELQAAIYTLSRYRRQVHIALFLSVAQQFCGQTIVLSYSPMIFAEASKKDNEAASAVADDVEDGDDVPNDWSTVAVGLVKFIVTVLVIWRIEYVGRRILLLAGTSLIALGLVALIIAFGGSTNSVNNDMDGADTQRSFWNPMTELKTFHLALPGVLLVVTGYSMSFGPMTVSIRTAIVHGHVSRCCLTNLTWFGAKRIVAFDVRALSNRD
jgi:MFS family permease